MLQFKVIFDGLLYVFVMVDIVIVCDGINFVLCCLFYFEEIVVFIGINIWCGVMWCKLIFDGCIYLWVGLIKIGKIVIYLIIDDIDGLGDQLINWIVEIEGDSNVCNDWNQKGDCVDFLLIYESFKFDWFDVGQLICDVDIVLEYLMVDKDLVDCWMFGCVMFVGDVVYLMYLCGLNGLVQVLIDVCIFVDLLVFSEDLFVVFVVYEVECCFVIVEIVCTNCVSLFDIINFKVEELVGDWLVDNFDDFILQDELCVLFDQYKCVVGFSVQDVLFV